MILQRKYYHDTDGIKSPVVNGIRVKRLSAEQRFTPKLVATGKEERWLSLNEATSKITIHAEGGDINFNILTVPGRYCAHCNEKLVDDSTGEAAREHVATNHAGIISPDPQNPAGYAMLNYYDCVLIEGSK